MAKVQTVNMPIPSDKTIIKKIMFVKKSSSFMAFTNKQKKPINQVCVD